MAIKDTKECQDLFVIQLCFSDSPQPMVAILLGRREKVIRIIVLAAFNSNKSAHFLSRLSFLQLEHTSATFFFLWTLTL